MQDRYQVKFELGMNSATSVNNYEYLDILDRAWTATGSLPPQGGVLCDVGCASFWYAATLDAFFRPRALVGVEVEGHRLFRGGHSRLDHAAGYVSRLPNAHFMVADYGACHLPADVVTAWFPFLTPAAILAWRLPLTLLAPERLFHRIRANLCEGGRFVMVNHGVEEARLAREYCDAAGLRRQFSGNEPGLLSDHRVQPALLSCWSAD